MGGRKQDLTGCVFERLTVTGRGEPYISPGGSTKNTWNCVCSCGKQLFNVFTSHITGGGIKSCGCYRLDVLTKHGQGSSKNYRSREYRIWLGMKQRCLNPKCSIFKYYGARGVKVCDRWVGSFEAFFEDMGKCPNGFSLDRINNDLGYFPENCRWSSSVEQMRNTRNTNLIKIKGDQRCISDWANAFQVCVKTLRNWQKEGLSGDDMLNRLVSKGKLSIERQSDGRELFKLTEVI